MARWLLIAAAVLLVFLVFPTPFFLVAVLAGLAWLVWWLIRSARQQQAQAQPQPQVRPQPTQGGRS